MKQIKLSGILVVVIFLVVGLWGYFLFYSFVYLPGQGKLSNVLPDTSWINADLQVFYEADHSLYSISIQGTNKKKIYDNVNTYELSPDGKRVAMWVWSKTTKDSLLNIIILDLVSEKAEVVENNKKCGPPSWLPDSSAVVYPFGDGYDCICIFNITEGTKKIINTTVRITDLAITKDGKRIVYGNEFRPEFYQYNLDSGEITELQKIKRGTLGNELCRYIDEKEFYWGLCRSSSKSLDGKVEAYNKRGSLWFKSNGRDELLVEYKGKYDPELAFGIMPLALSQDTRYVAFSFGSKIYIVDTLLKKRVI